MLGRGMGATCWLDGGWGDWAWEFPRPLVDLVAALGCFLIRIRAVWT